jgi:hypothetical protein
MGGARIMLKINSKAEIKAITVRKQMHGEELVKAVSVRLHFPAVSLDDAREFVSQLHLFYGTELESQFPEIDYLPVTRKVPDALVTIGSVKLRGEVKDAKIYPRGNRTVEIDLKVNAQIDKGLDKLHDVLMELVAVDILESPAMQEQKQQVQEQEAA